MAKAMSGKEMERAFQATMERMREKMRRHLQKEDMDMALGDYHAISGAAAFAHRLDIISWDQERAIEEETWAAYTRVRDGREDDADEVC